MTFKFRVLTTASPKQPLVKNITKPILKPHALDSIICQKLLTMSSLNILRHCSLLLKRKLFFIHFLPMNSLSLSSSVDFPLLSLSIESWISRFLVTDNSGQALDSDGGVGSRSSKLGHGGGLTLVLSQFDFDLVLILKWVFMDLWLG